MILFSTNIPLLYQAKFPMVDRQLILVDNNLIYVMSCEPYDMSHIIWVKFHDSYFWTNLTQFFEDQVDLSILAFHSSTNSFNASSLISIAFA